MPYIYLFHVKAFFILPFFYKSSTTTLRHSFEKNFIRLYYPFLIFFILLSIIYYLTYSAILDPNKLANGLGDIESFKFLYFINTVVTGNAYLIDYYTGYQFLWFLPVMFSMMIIKNYLQNKKSIKNIALILGFLLYMLIYVFNGYSLIRYRIMLFSPFAIIQGIAMFFLGYSCSYIILGCKYNKYITRVLCIMYIISSIFLLYKLSINPDYINSSNYNSSNLFTISTICNKRIRLV